MPTSRRSSPGCARSKRSDYLAASNPTRLKVRFGAAISFSLELQTRCKGDTNKVKVACNRSAKQ